MTEQFTTGETQDDADDGKVTISAERYKELIEAEETLLALEAAGVDNWEGYGEAFGDRE